jgi:hypothetical protein
MLPYLIKLAVSACTSGEMNDGRRAKALVSAYNVHAMNSTMKEERGTASVMVAVCCLCFGGWDSVMKENIKESFSVFGEQNKGRGSGCLVDSRRARTKSCGEAGDVNDDGQSMDLLFKLVDKCCGALGEGQAEKMSDENSHNISEAISDLF